MAESMMSTPIGHHADDTEMQTFERRDSTASSVSQVSMALPTLPTGVSVEGLPPVFSTTEHMDATKYEEYEEDTRL